MLQTLVIENFQKIKRFPLRLEKLAKINYLVGENGCGKSSILKFLEAKYGAKTAFYEPLEVSYLEGEKNLSQKIQSLLGSKKLQQILQLLQKNGFEEEEKDWQILTEKAAKLLLLIHSWQTLLLPQHHFLLLDEPEIHLHPKLQKLIPLVLEQIDPQIQIFVATHSPFLISAAGERVEEKLQESGLKRRDFAQRGLAEQKVYPIENGFCTYPQGRLGYKAARLSAQMLGAGIGDLVPKVDQTHVLLGPTSPVLILCEGESGDADCHFYNQIFCCHNPQVLFVSSTGKSNARVSFELLSQIKSGLYSNFRMWFLQDRDHEFKTQEDISNYLKRYPNHRVLHRRAIECYIYDAENLRSLCSSRGWLFEEKWARKIDQAQQLIARSAQKGKNIDYKSLLTGIFGNILEQIRMHKWRQNQTNSDNSQKSEKRDKIPAFEDLDSLLVQQIRPGSKAYQELHQAIFLE